MQGVIYYPLDFYKHQPYMYILSVIISKKKQVSDLNS